jgi:hypothetical protein
VKAENQPVPFRDQVYNSLIFKLFKAEQNLNHNEKDYKLRKKEQIDQRTLQIQGQSEKSSMFLN